MAILATAIWGCNFSVITLALTDLSPYLLGALRFFLTSVPAIFFLPKPKVSYRLILAYGLSIFGLQFALLFAGMHAGMPPGLTSLILQCQVFFSIVLAAVFLKETPSPLQMLGAIISFAGLGLVWINYTDAASWTGFILVITAALAMGAGNLFARKLAHVNSYSLVAWGSFVSTPLLFGLTFYTESPSHIWSSLMDMSWVTLSALAFITYISTWIGYGIWNTLLREYTISAVIPFTLLVPVFGMCCSYLAFGEPIQQWKLSAAYLIIGGLAVNVLGSHLITRRQKSELLSATEDA
ncbi:MAG: O-acetylserine/cysteine exporter [Legionella sp.]|nr:MAG: O-acetylserine/cysteine exporter [Legionella sp.]